LHVGTRAAVAHGAALGSGHETVHLSADTGFFMLFAENVQEAVDFTYIARRVAEESLVPGMVVMDGEQTALAMQDVRLLSPTQVNDFIGAAREQIEAPTAAQKLLFGEMRRRVPAWHDLDEPVLTGALFEKESFALGALARGPFFDAFVDDSLSASFSRAKQADSTKPFPDTNSTMRRLYCWLRAPPSKRREWQQIVCVNNTRSRSG